MMRFRDFLTSSRFTKIMLGLVCVFAWSTALGFEEVANMSWRAFIVCWFFQWIAEYGESLDETNNE